MNAKPRINWIDYAKFIGIFLVVLGHSSIPKMAVNFIYSFHMPLFFFISGYLFDFGKFHSFMGFVKHRFRQLIIPYFFFNLITYLFWLFIGRKFGTDSIAGISVTTPLVGIFYGTDAGNYLIHCGSLWFLPCLFVVEVIYFSVYGKLNKWIVLMGFAIVGYINYKMQHFMLPLSFDVALIAIVFYAAGNFSKNMIINLVDLKPFIKVISCLISLFFLTYFSYLNGRADMSSNTYTNYVLFLVIALAGIYFTVIFSLLLGDFPGKNPWIEFFAKNTLVILAFHSIMESVLKGIMYFLFKIPVEIFKETLFLNILLSFINLICLVPVIFILDRYLPFILGRNFQRNKIE